MAEVVGGMTGAIQGTVTGVINQGQSILDRFFPPERRNELWAKFSKFATEKPMLVSFLLSQIALSGIPLALFVVMTITIFVFALVAALLIGVLGALLFTAFCVGFALLVLLPTLFITTFFAAFVWLWGVGAYYLIKWFNQKEIPGIHTGFKEGIMAKLHTAGADEEEAGSGEEKMQPKKLENGSANKGGKKENKANGAAPKLPAVDKVGDAGKATGVDVGNVGDVKSKADVGNVKKSVPGGVL